MLPASLAGNVVRFDITNDGLGDDDMVADGRIVDQSGPVGGNGAAVADIPTLLE